MMTEAAPHEPSKLSIEADRSRTDCCKIDLIDRDPEHINDSLKTTFRDVFAEPDPTIFSYDQVWSLSNKVFSSSKLWCYRITTLICAVPLALLWGVYFALMSCCIIWVCNPYYRVASIKCVYFAKCYQAFLNACVEPWFVAFSRVFSNVRINLQKN